jgi:transcriptional regulator with XRE-family HTH domain
MVIGAVSMEVVRRMANAPVDQLVASVGRRIAELRVERGLTQDGFAEKAGVSSRYVASVEAGGENLTLTSLARFARLLRVPPIELLRPPTRRNARIGRPRTVPQTKKRS